MAGRSTYRPSATPLIHSSARRAGSACDMSLSGINFSGISSGIDTDSIISQLVKLQSQPIVKMQQQQQTIQQQQTAITQISAMVSSIQAAAGALNGTTGFTQVTASNSDDTIATVS